MEDFLGILDRIRGGVILCNFNSITHSSCVTYINRGWTDITGYTAQDLETEKGGNPQALVLHEDKPNADAQYAQQLCRGNTYELLYRIVHKSGTIRWVIDKGTVTRLTDGTVQNQSILTEVTAIKQREEHLRQLAQTDLLTDLNNKVTFTIMAQNVLRRQNNKLHALMLLDIDGFKGVNDNYGHAFGDKVLEAVAVQMKELFRSRDILGRVGGDEFMILMADIPSAEIARAKADTLRQAIESIRLAEMPHAPITVSIGIAISSMQSEEYDELFACADSALYHIKSEGRNGCMICTPNTAPAPTACPCEN